MAFPETGILDNFNRANEGPPPSVNWINDAVGLNGMITVNNQCAGVSGPGDFNNAWWGTIVNANCEVYTQIPVVPGANDSSWLFARFNTNDSLASGYVLEAQPTQIVLYRQDGGALIPFGVSAIAVSDGDWIGLGCKDNIITGYYSSDGATWTAIIGAIDATYNNDGYIGFGINGTTGRFDNFGGGGENCTFVYTDNFGSNDTRPFTFLSLPRYAQILGLNPIQFFGANSTVVSNRHCDDTWFEYVYQDSGKAARYEILLAIAQAEEELIRQVGYFPAPYWIADEKQDYPQLYQKEYTGRFGYKPNGIHKSVTTDLKYVICGGIRATTQITDFTYCNDIDTDGDGFLDTAVFQVNGVDFSPCELKSYIKQYAPGDEENCRTDMSSVGADPAWELRDIQIRYDETNEIALVYIKKWLLFKPQLQQAINAEVIDADDAVSYVDTVEFWRVYNDAETQVQFLWANEKSCASQACAWATQTGCLRVQNSRQGIIVPQPGTYTNNAYSITGFSQGIEPNKVRLWYYAGYQDANARGCDKLNQQWARIIAMLATARIAKPICSCENLVRKVSLWQEDVSLTNDVRSFNINPTDLSNPFGTKLGEILAWNALKNFGMKVGKRILTY